MLQHILPASDATHLWNAETAVLNRRVSMKEGSKWNYHKLYANLLIIRLHM